MHHSTPSPIVSVQVMQALVARELVDGFGLPERKAANLLGIVPSSVSQYLSGKRLGPTVSPYFGDEEARRIARRTAQQLMAGAVGSKLLLEAAIQLSEQVGGHAEPPRGTGKDSLRPELQRKVPRWLRNRIAGEQNAVAECMRLAQRSRDELTRALFRQIASDSLRHAEIVASLAGYLDRGVVTSAPTGISREDVEHLIQREHEAEATSEIDLGPELGGMMRVLWESMESDEHKHERLLQLLLRAGLADRPAANRAGKRSGRRAARSPNRRP
jgi:uncharacterized protein